MGLEEEPALAAGSTSEDVTWHIRYVLFAPGACHKHGLIFDTLDKWSHLKSPTWTYAFSSLDQAELCAYEGFAADPTPLATVEDKASRDPPILEALTSLDIKADITARLSDTDPPRIMAMYSKTIHPWFSIFSQPTLCGRHPATWEAASVDFMLLCFAIVLLNCAPQQLQGVYTLHSTHKSMYLMSKTWITLLEGACWNSIDLVKARIIITLFEISHAFDIAAYLSIAQAVRAADALVVFQQQGTAHPLTEQDYEEYTIMWWGIAILDRFAVHFISAALLLSRWYRLVVDSWMIDILQPNTINGPQ